MILCETEIDITQTSKLFKSRGNSKRVNVTILKQ